MSNIKIKCILMPDLSPQNDDKQSISALEKNLKDEFLESLCGMDYR